MSICFEGETSVSGEFRSVRSRIQNLIEITLGCFVM